MPFTPYALPARAVGTSNRIPVEDPNQAILFSHFHDRALSDAVEVPVTLLPDPRGGGFKVKWDFGVVGTLPAEFREQFPEVERVTGSQLTPQVTAEIRLVQNAGLGVTVLLVDPDWCVPVNDPLDEPWTLLPPGRALDLDSTVDGDLGEEDLAALGTAQLLVELTEVGGRVTALFDGRVLGVVTRWDSLKLTDALDHFSALGLRVMARAFVADGAVSVECARTSELTEQDLEPEISPLPRLTVPSRRATGPVGPGIAVDPDGEWSVHLPSNSFEAVAPGQTGGFRKVHVPDGPDTSQGPRKPEAELGGTKPPVPDRPRATEVIRVVEDDVTEAGVAPVLGIPGPLEEARDARDARQRSRSAGTPARPSWIWWGLAVVVIVVVLVLIALLG